MESNSKSRYEITAPSILRFRAHLMNATVIRRMPERKKKKEFSSHVWRTGNGTQIEFTDTNVLQLSLDF